MIKPEIERKFLICLSEELDKHISLKTDIVQTYLLRKEPDIQRRVRMMTTNGKNSFFYTEKRFVSPVEREENECMITLEEYRAALTEADDSLVPVIKTRKVLNYENQGFEIDCYPFSDKLATMELELENAEQSIVFPPFVKVIKEVTGDKRYSNAAIAAEGRFPDDI